MEKLILRFFVPLERIPSVTSQEKGVNFERRTVYTKPEVLEVKQLYRSHLAAHRPPQPLTGPIGLRVTWCYEESPTHPAGTWKTTKPDTDNLIKLLKDVMTELGYWKDDAQVCREQVEKLYEEECGVIVAVAQI